MRLFISFAASSTFTTLVIVRKTIDPDGPASGTDGTECCVCRLASIVMITAVPGSSDLQKKGASGVSPFAGALRTANGRAQWRNAFYNILDLLSKNLAGVVVSIVAFHAECAAAADGALALKATEEEEEGIQWWVWLIIAILVCCALGTAGQSQIR